MGRAGGVESHEFLSLRAVEVVRLASNRVNRLAALIAQSAGFNLGAGDEGRALGTGVDGIRKLVLTMKADTYRFLGWDDMDMPVDPCSKHKVEVELNHPGFL